MGLDEDHVSIAKPRTPDAQVCGAARDLLRTVVLAQRPAPASNPTAVQVQPGLPAPAPQAVIVQFAPSGAAAPRRIPHELPPAAEHYFGRQTELAQLIERLQAGKSTAVVGPAGLGKTALAAEAVRAVTGTTLETLARSPFPDGVVFLDLYTFHGQAEPAWNTLANKLEGPDFRERETGRERATEACRARRFLLVIEGGEEADGEEGRAEIRELLGVLSPENRRLLLTRLSTQAAPAESVELKEALPPEEAEKLLDSLAGERLPAAVRARVLELLEGHPLALTWAGGLLARDEEDPDRLVRDWDVGGLPGLSDPRQAEHTLKWLFARSVRGLDAPAQQVLAAAGLLARAPVPLAAAEATLGEAGEEAARDALKTLVRRGLLRRAGETDHWQLTHVLGYRFARQETGSDPELRERLGRWLHGHLQEALASGSDDDALLSRTRALEHTAALLRADDDQRLWRPLANFVLYDVWRRLMDLGRLGLARLALTAVAGWLERLPVGKAEDPGWLREKSSLLDREGDVQRDQGDLAAALTAYRESLAIRQQLAAADPAHAGRQWDLSISYERVGDVLQNQGDLAAALTAYRESLAIRQQLAAADPAHAGWQRGLSISHNKVGDVLRNQGDLDTALTAYRESLA
ncbi:MAG TPA: tetratricopeptide repeat protein, partial [Thermoanaerobaculia bacterium]|nr:tetratricopeptide repeat protein [Thermoanaerobaculia bacterium]